MLSQRKIIAIRPVKLSPPQTLALGFLVLIGIGALLLMLPIATNSGHRLSLLDALFEATSAVCVTGLVVVDTATTFTPFGEIVLLTLIQIGGLGFMTFGILVALLVGKRIGLKERLLVQSSLNQFNLSGLVKLVKLVLVTTFLIEGIGALLLTLTWQGEMGWGRAAYNGIFHSISSFNNAGFDIMGDFKSLTEYVGSVPVNLTIASLFILGGIGFTVILDVFQKQAPRRWSLNTKLVLISTLLFNVTASILIFWLERGNPGTLQPLNTLEKITASFFHGTVPRTAGFNTLDLTQLNQDSVLLTMLLMFVGGASGSTAGGIKITTFFLLLLVVWAFIKQSDEVNLYKRRIPSELILKALSITLIGAFFIITSVFLLKNTEDQIPLMNLAFEATSAFATVGLSLGVTPELSPAGKVIIMVLMFIGRIGPLTLAFALIKKKKKSSFQYPEEKILIG